MKVLVFNTLYYPHRFGGAEKSLQDTLEALKKEFDNIEIEVVSLSERRMKSDVVNGIKVHYLRIPNIYWPFSKYKHKIIGKTFWHLLDFYNLFSLFSSYFLMRRIRPDIVLTSNLAGFSTSVWTAAFKLNIKVVHVARDYYLFSHISTMFKRGRVLSPRSWPVMFWSFIKKRQSKKIAHFVGISEFVRNYYLDNGFFNKENSSVIYNPVECEPKSVRKTNQRYTFGYLGSISSNKGFFDFCDLSRKMGGSCNFIAAGLIPNYELESKIQTIAEQSNVSLLGFVDKDVFVNKVDALIIPVQWNEPFGRTVVEFSLNNKLVFVNPIGGISELQHVLPNVYDLKLVQSYIDFELRKVLKHHKDPFSFKTVSNKFMYVFESVSKNEN